MNISPFYVFFSIEGKTSAVLQEAQVEIIPSNVCNSSDAYGGLVNDNMICAGSLWGGTDTCQVRRTITPKLPLWKPPSQSVRGMVMTSLCSIIH